MYLKQNWSFAKIVSRPFFPQWAGISLTLFLLLSPRKLLLLRHRNSATGIFKKMYHRDRTLMAFHPALDQSIWFSFVKYIMTAPNMTPTQHKSTEEQGCRPNAFSFLVIWKEVLCVSRSAAVKTMQFSSKLLLKDWRVKRVGMGHIPRHCQARL